MIISNNSIGDEGIEEICEAIERSQTLRALHIAFCQVTEHGGERLQAALADNSTIVEIDVHGNYMSEAQESLIVVRSFYLSLLMKLISILLLFRLKLKQIVYWKIFITIH